MAVEKRVLIVSPTPSLAQAVTASVKNVGYSAVVAKSFAEAKKQLGLGPHLLVTELKLGEYNGLHLALRAITSEIPAIVISERGFEQEIEQLGACWTTPEAATTDELQNVMLRLVQGVPSADFWPTEATLEGRVRLMPPPGGAQLH
jgi:CheY-like chemotaxis protein